MQRQLSRHSARMLAAGAAAAVLLYWGRHVLAALATQLAGGYVLMAMALPLCRRLERRLSPGAAAAAAMASLGIAAAGAVMLLIPPLVSQLKQLTATLPGIIRQVEAWLMQGQALLSERGIDLAPLKTEALGAISSRAGTFLSTAAGAASQAAQAIGKLVLAPLIGFYLLRDRRKIASMLMLLLPVRYRAQAVRAAREMRRETAGFLRGQLMLSAAVAVMTAVGLALVGTQGWLVLGLLMGVLELVPYIGPLIAGIPAVLMALQGGLWQALWTLGVILVVQQAEGSFLSPRMMSGATRLHPLVVLLTVSAGGIFAGTIGMILALPFVVSMRGALRGLRRQQP